MKTSTRIAGHAIAQFVNILKRTCRVRLHNDPRPKLRSAGKPYVYAVLHAHQLATIFDAEPGVAAMVSHSADGDLLIPVLNLVGVKPIRGSSRRRGQDKGGIQALDEMIAHVASGKPAYIAVDGPRGPRNRIRKGIAQLSISASAAVLVAVAIPTRRWILRKAWDQMQIPKPFCTIDGYFGDPLYPEEGESVEQFRRRIEAAINALEREHDPTESTPP
ncbi:DUF374 domain-containing protein [Bythopirellula polymerisocia]|uniref:DUF374 domain-containing protein n=1 Tax=Bythopirellula polymerisocia TaxID=2528003 RepID=A0A5C6CZ76_9BACT|nr:DUF374 domain-containing protein [Bythopirellula polymerisocia]TWU28316.1 hypothetical protein Pla144_16030 [Bythopirellula polymerisocia]